MKKFIILVLLSLVLVIGVYAKGDSEGGKRTIRFGMNDNPGGIPYAAVEEFKKYVESQSNEINIIIYPSNQLGDHRAMTEQLRAGELDIQQIGYPDMSYLIPELKIIGEPYVIRDFEHLQRVVAGEYGKNIDEKMNKLGIKVLGVGYYGTRQTTSNVPINSIDDLKGIKLRVPNVDFLIDYADAVGATATPVAFQEVYLALSTNQVDGEENPLPTIDTMKFYEVQKYIALTNHFIASQAIIINDDLWNTLSDKERNIVQEAVRVSNEYLTREIKKQEQELIAVFESRGLTVTRPDTKPFREAMKPYYKKLDETFGAGSVEKVMNY